MSDDIKMPQGSYKRKNANKSKPENVGSESTDTVTRSVSVAKNPRDNDTDSNNIDNVERAKSISESWAKDVSLVIILPILFIIVSIYAGFISLAILGIIVLANILVVLRYSLREVSAEYVALKKRFGKVQNKIYTNGTFWSFPIIDKMVLFPTEIQIIKLEPEDVITLAKKLDFGDGLEKFDATAAKILGTLSFNWPDNFEDLKKAFVRAPDPSDKTKIFDFFAPSATSAIREASGWFAWIEIQRNSKEYRLKLKQVVQEDNENPFAKAGIKDFLIKVRKLELPTEFLNSLNSRQEARYKADAAKETAIGNREKSKIEGDGIAYALMEKLKAMRTDPEMAKYDTVVEMSKSQTSTVLYSIPNFLENKDSGRSEADDFFRKYLPVGLALAFESLTPKQKEAAIQKILLEKGTDIEKIIREVGKK